MRSVSPERYLATHSSATSNPTYRNKVQLVQRMILLEFLHWQRCTQHEFDYDKRAQQGTHHSPPQITFEQPNVQISLPQKIMQSRFSVIREFATGRERFGC